MNNFNVCWMMLEKMDSLRLEPAIPLVIYVGPVEFRLIAANLGRFLKGFFLSVTLVFLT